jgi:putative RNA 2'-phosphotransferase
MEKKLAKLSKFMSLVLRHQPETIGLTLDGEGWADVTDMLARMNQHGTKCDLPLLEQVVSTNDKQRFAFNADRTKIRANQGHSVEIDLALRPQAPPEILLHGTVAKFLDSILAQGLLPGSRQHVHLSTDEAVARSVGARRGQPVVLRVRAGEMHRAGHEFFCSENGVWLTAQVPAQYLVDQ